MKEVIILSGGLDSTTLVYDRVDKIGNDNVHCLSFNYNQRHVIELDKARTTCKKLKVDHKIIDMTFLGIMYKDVCALSEGSLVNMPTIKDVLGDPAPVTEVPYRNMIMLTLALGYAQSIGAKNVYFGAQLHDEYSYWDTSITFVDLMNQISSLNRKHNIRVNAPYAAMSKFEEIAIGTKLNVPFEDTWTCYAGPNDSGEACGVCPSCSERIMNFAQAGIVDPIPYAIPIDWIGLIEDQS